MREKYVKVLIQAPIDVWVELTYDKLFPKGHTLLAEYEIEGGYVVELEYANPKDLMSLNNNQFVTVKVVEIPNVVRAVMSTWDCNADEYAECRRLENDLEPLGWTFDWYLDGEPYNLRKIEETW